MLGNVKKMISSVNHILKNTLKLEGANADFKTWVAVFSLT